MAVPSSLPPQLSLGLVRSRSRLSIAAHKPYVEYFLGQEDFQNDRKEARRKLGRSGRVMEDAGSSSESDDSSGWDLLQQTPPAEGVRRVTFSTGGAADQQQPQPDQPQPVTPQLARLWRGPAASVCAGQRLQSLERHAAELKQRQEVHTELKAWVELALSAQHQDIFLDHEHDGHDTTDPGQRHITLQKRHHHHHHHHHGDHNQHQQQQQQRRSHHRSRRRHHRHHRSGSGSVSSVVPDPDPGTEQSTEAAAQTAIPAAAEPGCEAVQQAEQTTGLTAAVPMQLHQDAEQWQQFNVAEQQLIQQLQQDQHMLLEQLQLAYQQIALLTAAQQTQGPSATDDSLSSDVYHHTRVSCSPQQGSGPVEHPDIVLHPSPETQVLVISQTSNTNSPEQPSIDAGSLVTDICNQPEQQQEEQQQQQQQQSEPANARVSAPRCSDSSTQRRSSTSTTPRSRLATSKGSTGVQPSSGPKTPRAASTKAAKAPGAAPRASSTAAHEAAAGPAKLTPRQAAKSTTRPSISMPQGRGLTLEQQQALVQRLQQAEGVMELLQRDLQTSLEAQTQLQQQLQQQSQQAGPSCAARQLPNSDQHSSLQQQEQQLQPAGQASAGACESQHLQELTGQAALLDVGVQCGDEAGSGLGSSEELVQALQQQLQDQLLEVSTARQQLCELQQADEAQKQQVAQLQEQLKHHQQQEQQYMQRMQSLQQELTETTDRLVSLQQEYQKLVDNTEQRQQQHLRQQGEVRECMAQQPSAADDPGCCAHEARCQQLQSMLHALLLQMQQQEARPYSKLYSTATDMSCMRPQTAAVHSPLKVRATWQHRPVEMRTWLCPPLQPTRPATAGTPQSAQLPAGALSDRSHFRPQPTGSHRYRNQASGALTARCDSATPQQSVPGLQEGLLQPGECKLRPLTYRGPDRGAAGALGTAAASSRRRLSVDAERGLLASLRVAPCSAGRSTTLGKGTPSQQQASSGSEPADALRAADAANSVTASVAHSPRRCAGNRAAGLAASAFSAGDWCAAQGGASSPRRSPEGGRRCVGNIPRLMLSALH